jgi:uncharacterized protein (TIGR02246 family)
MNPDEHFIRRAVVEWMEATRRGDTSRVLEMMDDDVTFLGPGRAPMRGKKAFEEAARAMEGKVRIEGAADVQEVRVFGDWAYSWVQLTVNMQPLDGGKPTHRSGPAMSVWRKLDGWRWVIYRDANMVMTDQP